MVNILPLLQPLIGEVGGVSVSLTLQNCILGHIESGVLWGDDDDWRSFGRGGGKTIPSNVNTVCTQRCSRSRSGLKSLVLSFFRHRFNARAGDGL